MTQTTPENDKPLEVPVGTTVKGVPLVVVPTQTGLYKIEYRGPGPAPKITDQLFTSLLLAKRAMDSYFRANAAAFAKEEIKRQTIEAPTHKEQRKAEAQALKNGSLITPEPDDES